MKNREPRWILVADSHKARLFEGTFTSQGRLHLQERDAVEFPSMDKEHWRPSPRGGKNGHTYASVKHEEEERLQRCSKELLAWLEGQLDARAIDKVRFFAPARLLGEVRRKTPPSLNGRLEESEGVFTRMGASDLLRHPGVRAFLTEG